MKKSISQKSVSAKKKAVKKKVGVKGVSPEIQRLVEKSTAGVSVKVKAEPKVKRVPVSVWAESLPEPKAKPEVKAEVGPEEKAEPDVAGMAGVMLGDMEGVLRRSIKRMRERETLRPTSLEGVNRRIEEARDKLKLVRGEIKRARIHLIASIHEEREVEAWMRSLEEMRGVFLDEE